MASKGIKLKLTYSQKWVKQDADGQDCSCCGDKCYLFQVTRMAVSFDGWKTGKLLKPVICNSCFDDVIKQSIT